MAGEPYLGMSIEAVGYSGQDPVFCHNIQRMDLIEGHRYAMCTVVWPYDGAGNPTSFSPSNSFRTIVQDGCGTVQSDVTYYNIYSAYSDPRVLHGLTPIPGGIFSVPRSSVCASGWTATVIFTGSTLDGTPVTSASAAVGDVTPPPPPPSPPVEQLHGSDNFWDNWRSDPVNSLTGEFSYHPDAADIRIASKGDQLGFERSYASGVTRDVGLGPGWSHTYNATMIQDPVTGDVDYQTPSGATQHFRSMGNGTFETPMGVTATLTFSSGSYRLSHKDQTIWNFDAAGQLTSIRDRNGQGVTVSGSTVSAAGGRSLTLSRSGSRITEVSSSDGRKVTFGYNMAGQLVSATDADGQITSYSYDGAGRLSSVQDPNGNFPVRVTYDDTTGRVIAQGDASGHQTTFGWVQDDPNCDLCGTATITDPRGHDSTDRYTNGFLVQSTDAAGQPTYYLWDLKARLVEVVDAHENRTTFTYDEKGNLLKRSSVTNKTTTDTYEYSASNDVTSFTDMNGVVTTYAYDTAGNLKTISRPNVATGSGTVVTTTHTYNGDGTLRTTTDANGHTTSFGYDSAGDLTSVLSPGGRKTTYTYDLGGRPTSTVDPRGNVVGADPDSYRTQQTFDPLGRVTSATDALGHQAKYTYTHDGDLETIQDAKGRTTTYSYFPTGWLKSAQGPDVQVGAQTFTYDSVGNRTTSTSPGGVRTTWTYSPANAVETVSSTGTGTWSYTYDELGRLATQTAPSERKVTFTRTLQGLVSSVAYSDGTPGVSFTYDNVGNRTTARSTNGTTASFAYNAWRQLTRSTSADGSFSYTFDNAGNPTGRSSPIGSQTFGYDLDGRLTSVVEGTTTLVGYSYNDATGTETTTYPGGVTRTEAIDAAGFPTIIEARKGPTVLHRSQYTLDAVGNPTSITKADGTTDSYAYDARDQLLAACIAATTCPPTSPTAAYRWTYDADGNRRTQVQSGGATTYTYDTANRLVSRTGLAGAATYSYDPDGNLTGDGQTTYAWNAAGQLSAAGSTTYGYDPFNNRTSISQGKAVVKPVTDLVSGHLALERDSRNRLLRAYAPGLSGFSSGGNAYGYVRDGLGSVRAVIDGTGNAQITQSYHPFGETRSSTTTGRKAPTNVLGFTGAYVDGPLYKMGAREYDPANGRFLSPDPAGIPGLGYLYASNNPLTATDPTGLSDYDWRKIVHDVSQGLADVAAGVGVVCTVAVVCVEIAPVAFAISGTASIAANLTSDQAASCYHGAGGCATVVTSAAVNAITKGRGAALNAGRGADFIASVDGVVVPTSRSRMVGTFKEAGLPSTPTTAAGLQYTLPDGTLVRVMEPSGQAPLRASFTNANGGPINPFTGKPVQPPSGLSKAERLEYNRSRTHIELGP